MSDRIGVTAMTETTEYKDALISIATARQEADDFDHPDFDWRALARRMETIARGALDNG